ncbi:MAG: TolC family outer membrane protein [Geminicoccaceae bacterium]
MLALVLSGMAPIAFADGTTLAEALASAYATNPRLEAARAATRAADEGVPQARAAGRPQLISTSSAGVNALGDDLPVARQSLALSQLLYAGGGVRAATKAAERSAEAEGARQRQIEQEVLVDAVRAFTAVVRDRRVLELARENEDSLRLELEATRDRERFGDLTETDIHQADSRHAAGTAGRIAAEGALEIAEADYERAIGDRPGTLDPAPLPEAMPATLDQALSQAEESWAVQAAEADLDAARESVDVSLAAIKPRLTLVGELSYAADGGQQYGSGGGAAVGATLSVPLYQGGGDYARIRQSREVLSQRRYARDDARRATRSGVVEAWAATSTAAAMIRSVGRQVTAARFALAGVRQEAAIGARGVVDILDAERELFEAEVDLVRAERDRVLAAYRLLAAIGRLTAGDLGLPRDGGNGGSDRDVVDTEMFDPAAVTDDE